jgi:hypothetical protein
LEWRRRSSPTQSRSPSSRSRWLCSRVRCMWAARRRSPLHSSRPSSYSPSTGPARSTRSPPSRPTMSPSRRHTAHRLGLPAFWPPRGLTGSALCGGRSRTDALVRPRRCCGPSSRRPLSFHRCHLRAFRRARLAGAPGEARPHSERSRDHDPRRANRLSLRAPLNTAPITAPTELANNRAMRECMTDASSHPATCRVGP